MEGKVIILSTGPLYTREWCASEGIFISTSAITDFKVVAEKFMKDNPDVEKLYLYEMSKGFLCCVDVLSRTIAWEDDYLDSMEHLDNWHDED